MWRPEAAASGRQGSPRGKTDYPRHGWAQGNTNAQLDERIEGRTDDRTVERAEIIKQVYTKLGE